jgi:para-nitrobenzyl esterase
MLYAMRSSTFFCRRLGTAALVLGLTGGGAVAANAAQLALGPPSVVQTANGRLTGTTIGNMEAYLGIPYAAPPVGPLRWRPPQPAPRWAGVRDAGKFAKHCPQYASPFGFKSLTEDCLYLNVYVPLGTKPGDKLPVMVWIHGGAFVSGESNDYDPDRLVDRHTIVVTLNYRLGYLGFLATTGLDAENHPHVNYGLLDQQAALGWVHANVASFGGDPSNTTTFGESAGGYSTLAQVFSPLATGLFQRAIVESGAYAILSVPTLQSAETTGNAVATAAGCTPSNTACLRALSVSQVLALQPGESLASLQDGPGPAIDGTVLPQAPETALLTGSYNHVPIVQGTNHDEFRLFTAEIFDLQDGPMDAQEYPFVVGQVLQAAGLGSDTQEVLAKYPLSNYKSPDLAFSALATDAAFATPAYITDGLFALGTPLFAYEFSAENAPEDFLPPVSFPYGSAHASELQFLFDSFTRKAPPLTNGERSLAHNMVGEWTTFAATAVPDASGLPLWTPYVPGADDLESLVPPTPHLFFTFEKEHNTRFWTNLLLGEAPSFRSARVRHDVTLQDIGTAVQATRAHFRLR